MPRILALASISVMLSLAALPAVAQSSSGGASKLAQMVQIKTPSYSISPEQQAEQRAAKSMDCRKQAKAQKLSGAKRRAFLKDCMKR